MQRAVFLDRDGVLTRVVVRNGQPAAPLTLDEFAIEPQSLTALPALRAAGFLLIVVTNQPDVARGWVAREAVEEMHRRLRAALPLDDIKVCWEPDGPDNTCYKPKPGMLLAAAAEHGVELRRSFMIGDRWRDVGAGRAAGCFTVFIDRGYAEPLRDTPDAVCADLVGAAAVVLDHAQHADHPEPAEQGGPRR
jgi:D-glycero-D-manno-heptose 1,7-bisphosphate phosphatase